MVGIGYAMARRSRASRSDPSGLRREETFRNSRGHGRHPLQYGATGPRPRCLGQFRLSFLAEPRWVPRSSGEVRFEPWHTLFLIP